MDRYSEGASSNPVQVNIFQLTSAMSDYHEKLSVHVSLKMIPKQSSLVGCEIIPQLTTNISIVRYPDSTNAVVSAGSDFPGATSSMARINESSRFTVQRTG